MIESIVSIIVGGLIGWLTSHAYYLKQEKSSPTPVLKEINTKIQSLEGLRDQIEQLYDLAVRRNDVELQNKIESLTKNSLETYLEILHSLLPYDLMIQDLLSAYDRGEASFNDKAAETLPKLRTFTETFVSARDALLGLLAATEHLGERKAL
jgi:conjugal transfer/entry exclusion protein